MSANCAGSKAYNVDAAMTERASVASMCGDSTVQCFKCDCAAGLCYVALRSSSLTKKKGARDSIKCPVHDKPSSAYAQEFYTLLERRSKRQQMHGIIWDWYDVPQNHHMHIDATVFCGKANKCSRFEIDGESHFIDNETARIDTDSEKDAHVTANGAGMLRLHYRDRDGWPTSISRALCKPPASVEYTSSYNGCLDDHEHDNDAARKKRKKRKLR